MDDRNGTFLSTTTCRAGERVGSMPSHSAKPSTTSDDFPSFRSSISPLMGSVSAFRSSSSSSSTERRRPRLRLLLSLLLLSTLAAQATPSASLQSTAVVMLLPVIHSTILGAAAMALLAFRARSGGAHRSFDFGQDRAERTKAVQAGVMYALSYLLGLWQARLLDIRLWATLSVRD